MGCASELSGNDVISPLSEGRHGKTEIFVVWEKLVVICALGP